MDNFIIPKRLLVIQDMVTVGRSSMSVAIPVISACKVQACPLVNAIFSNHMGFDSFYKKDLTHELEVMLRQVTDLALPFSGIYIGYLGSPLQLQILENHFKTTLKDDHNTMIVIDPVFADHGKCYGTLNATYYCGLRSLLKYATLITPNITEACYLTDTPYHEGSYTDEELSMLCQKLQELGATNIVITGIKDDAFFYNYIWEQKQQPLLIKKEISGSSRPGTGDIFASILAALSLRGLSLKTSVTCACNFIAQCTKASQEANIPIQEGVLLESFLHILTNI